MKDGRDVNQMRHARFFRIEEQWSVIYLPERPSGFAVCLLGDNGMLVEKATSDWETHPEKRKFIEDLLSRGYTLFTSSFFDRHWGSPRAFRLMEQLYHVVLKQEILNKKIHLFAEGTGALIALQWMNAHPKQLRSCYFVNPCLSLHAYYEQEKENKLYYKRFLKEMEQAYGQSEQQIDSTWIKSVSPTLENDEVPPLSIHCHMHEKHFPLQLHSRPFQQQLADKHIFVNLRIHGREKSFYKAAQSTFPFYRKYESIL